MNKDSIFALYARVSSDKQAKDKTIDSQIAALKEKITADGGTLIEDMKSSSTRKNDKLRLFSLS